MKKGVLLSAWVCLILCLVLPQSGLAQKRGGTFTFSAAADLKNLDLHKSFSGGDYEVLSVSVETLVGPNELGDPAPCLAESWESSNNATEWTFHLRKGVKFHNGREMTAKDVKWNMDRIMDPQTAAARRASFDMVKSVTVIDPYTIKFSLKRPFAAFLSSHFENTGPQASILAPESLNNDGTITQPIGTGPFKFVEWKPANYAKFVRFDDYWMKGHPYLDADILRPVPDDNARLTAVLTGDVDLGWKLPHADVARLIKEKPKGVELAFGSGYNLILCFNMEKAPFKDVRIRQAVAYAIDKNEINLAATMGHGLILDQEYARTNSPWHLEGVKDYSRDVAKAKALLAEAGYPNGLDAGTLLVSSSFLDWKMQAELVHAQLQEAGINLKMEVVEHSVFTDRAIKGLYDMRSYCIDATLDPDSLYRKVYVPGAPYSQIFIRGWSNEKMADLVEKAVQTTDKKERLRLYAEINKIQLSEVPMIRTALQPTTYAWKSYVKAYEVTPIKLVGYPGKAGIQNIWLDK